MDLQKLYPAVLVLVLVAILVGVGLTVLGNLAGSTGITAEGADAVNDSIAAIAGFVTWFTIIVLVIATGIVLGIVLKSFSGGR